MGKKSKVLKYISTTSLPSSPGRIIVDHQRKRRRRTKGKAASVARRGKWRLKRSSSEVHHPLPNIPASLTNLYDRHEMRVTLPVSRPSIAQAFLIEKYVERENRSTIKSKVRKKGDDKLKRNKSRIRRLLAALRDSRNYDFSAIKIQRVFRRHYRSRYVMASAKIIWWYKKLLAEWKHRQLKAEQNFKRIQLRFLVRCLKAWRTFAYQNKEVERRVKKLLASLRQKCLRSWNEWVVKSLQVKKRIRESQQNRMKRSHYSALIEYCTKMINVKHFIRKICSGVKQRFMLEWHDYVTMHVACRRIQCVFRVYAAKKILFAKRRRVVCTTLCFESILQARRLIDKWIRGKQALKIQRLFRGFISRKQSAIRYLKMLEKEKTRSSSEKQAMLEAGKSAIRICLRRYKLLQSSKSYRHKDYKELYARYKFFKRSAKQLIMYSPDSKLREGKKLITPANIMTAQRLQNAREAFAVYDPALVSKVGKQHLQSLLLDAKIPLSKEEALLLNRILPRSDGYVYERDFLNYVEADVIHVSVTGEHDGKNSISMNYIENFVRRLELEVSAKKRNLFSNARVKNLALRLLLLEAQVEAQKYARERYRVCYAPKFTCPLCHRDFLLSKHLLEHLGASMLETGLANLSLDRAKRIMNVRKPRECHSRTLKRFFEENFGNDLVDEMLEEASTI